MIFGTDSGAVKVEWGDGTVLLSNLGLGQFHTIEQSRQETGKPIAIK